MKSHGNERKRLNHIRIKETPGMSLRLKQLALALFAVLVLGVCVLPASPASAAPRPWWQVLTGSRPTNLWEPQSQIQEIKAPTSAFIVGVEGNAIGGFNPPFAEATAANLQATLEGVYGAGNVEVTGGPGGTAPLIVTWIGDDAGKAVAPVEILVGEAKEKVLQSGGSGHLVLTITNLGDAPVKATSSPVTIVDELPAGVEATGVEAFAGAQDSAGPVDCEVAPAGAVSCIFEGELPSYESIEVEIFASLTGQPPVQGAPGKVTVSGGNAATASTLQDIHISPEPTRFGIERFSAKAEEEGGEPATHAGSHPFQLTTTVQLNAGRLSPGPRRTASIEQPALPRNLRFPLPAGLVGNTKGMPQCAMDTFLTSFEAINLCPDSSAVGISAVTIIEKSHFGLVRLAVPVFNLPPAHGEPARFGFMVVGTPVVIDTAVDPDNQYRIEALVRNASQAAEFLSSTVTLWGNPSDSRHDSSRGWRCAYFLPVGPCVRPPNLDENAFLRQPVSCTTPLDFHVEMEPWNVPLGSVVATSSSTSDRLSGCNQVPFDPTVSSSPTSKLAGNPSGFDFQLTMPNSGLLNENATGGGEAKKAIAEGQAKKVEVVLPQGMTLNPSNGEGLVGCSPAEYARETASSAPGAGCPDASKVGEVQIATPLLEEEAHGSLYVATPHDNPFDSLIGLYMVARIPDRGILIKQAGKVQANPVTGQLTTTFDNVPQVPISSFKLHFREGGRAPLVTPPACGTYRVETRFIPWSATRPDNPAPEEIVPRMSPFTIERGVDGGACPSGGLPPFKPGLDAGMINNAAGSYSPFNVRLTRKDGEQEFTNFSIKLPPGISGKLAGIPFCSDAAIAAAKSRTGPTGGQEELSSPSCPMASQVGRTLVGAGVGSVLTYVPGKVYLAGPYHGSALSIVAITAAKVGPFDLGTVVVREALKINPETAEVFVDATGSDPIPHIIQGIVVHARDIRVYVDRPEFALNPTSCERTSTASTVLGSGLDFSSAADDQPVTVTSPFQAADCANLGFKPKLELSLRGGTRRAQNPALRAVLRPRAGDANAKRISVQLPHSEFLDQSHIRTVCTRAQFNAGAGNGAQCPAGAVYGHARAWSPLLDEPLEGPVFLRSSPHPLPDLVLAMHGLIDFNAIGRIDSVNGGIRNTFDFVPDAPITKVVLSMQGGKKGLLENSTNLCKTKNVAIAKLAAHNGKALEAKPVLQAKCPKGKKQKRHAAPRASR